MPKGDPFTALCQQAASLSRRVAADLHLHTTASDGDFTPSQVVAFARVARLDAIAVTDHDTFAGVGAAVEAAAGTGLRVIPGVEVTAEWDGGEVHVLGVFTRTSPPVPLSIMERGCSIGLDFEATSTVSDTLSDTPAHDTPLNTPSPSWRGGRGVRSLQDRLAALCLRRRDRFRDFIRLIRDAGHILDDGRVSALESATASLGRRHIANLLVRTGIARNYGEAWGRFVAPLSVKVIPKLMVPFAEATELIRAAGGVSVLAHPSPDLSETDFRRMKEAGLSGIEVKFPAAAVARTRTLTEFASQLGLLTTGGSDCHGPSGRPVGAVGATVEELRALCEATVGEAAH